MTVRIVCRKNEFHDSMVLMRINESIRQMEGVVRVAVLMATDNNKKILFDYRFWTDSIQAATAADLILAVEGIDDEAVEKALERVEQMFVERVASRRGKKIFKKYRIRKGRFNRQNIYIYGYEAFWYVWGWRV